MGDAKKPPEPAVHFTDAGTDIEGGERTVIARVHDHEFAGPER
jgi:hypothetical protein